MHPWSIIFPVLTASAYVSLPFSNLVVHESIQSVPNGFTRVASAPANQTLNLRLAPTNTNMTGLEELLYAVSTPGSPLYGQHLSKEEVRTESAYVLSCRY